MPRAHPVLPDEQRSKCHIPGTDHIGVSCILLTLTDTQETLLRAGILARLPAQRTDLTPGVGIHFHPHAPCKSRFGGKRAMKLGKGPFRGTSARSSLRACGLLVVLHLVRSRMSLRCSTW